MKSLSKAIISLILIISMLLSAVSCGEAGGIPDGGNSGGNGESSGNGNSAGGENGEENSKFYINGENRYVLAPGDTLTLTLSVPDGVMGEVEWTSSHSCVSVDGGVVSVISGGTSVVKATLGEYSDSVIILVPISPSDGDDSEDSDDGEDTSGDTNTDDTTDDNSGSGDNGNNSGDNSGNNDNTENGDNTENNNNGNEDDSTEDEKNQFGSEYNPITVEEALEIASQNTSSPSSERYYIVATVKQIDSASNGRMYIYDETGTIYVYKSTMLDGSSVSSSPLARGIVILICGTLRDYRGTLEIDTGTIIDFYNPNVPLDKEDPYINVDKDEFYSEYTPASSYTDAYYRTLHNLMSGTIGEQDQAPTISSYQPKRNGKFIRNTEMIYSEDGNTYYVVDAHGNIAMEIYRGAAYIMLEEVAAYVFAFGEPPANQTSSKNTSPSSSPWGEYLRLNHTAFSGSTRSYPYEPELPNISGCGGTLNYYEMDIGTTGTDCDPSYTAAIYNNGKTITRGAARIVYVCEDDDGNGTIDYDERYVFYTYNHYNDFQEYLNYLGGWGEMFGNITGGGKISSKTDYNPTPYVQVVLDKITSEAAVSVICFFDIKKYLQLYV